MLRFPPLHNAQNFLDRLRFPPLGNCSLFCKSFRCALFALHFGRQTPHIGLLCCGFVASLSTKIASSPTIFPSGKLLILHFAFPHRTFFFEGCVIILHFQLTKVENIAKKFNFLRKILQNRKKVVPLRLERWQSGRMRRSWKPLICEGPGVRIPLFPLKQTAMIFHRCFCFRSIRGIRSVGGVSGDLSACGCCLLSQIFVFVWWLSLKINFQPSSVKANNLRLQHPRLGRLSTAATVRIGGGLMERSDKSPFCKGDLGGV